MFRLPPTFFTAWCGVTQIVRSGDFPWARAIAGGDILAVSAVFTVVLCHVFLGSCRFSPHSLPAFQLQLYLHHSHSLPLRFPRVFPPLWLDLRDKKKKKSPVSMATFYLIINQRLMFEVLKDGMWGCSSLLVCRVQNHAVQINEMKSGICRWRSNYEIFSRHIKPRLHVLLEPVSHWSSPNACVDAHHHPYLLLFLDVDGKKFAPVVIHVMTLLHLCHSDIVFTLSPRHFTSPQREGRLSRDLIKQNGRHQSPFSLSQGHCSHL